MVGLPASSYTAWQVLLFLLPPLPLRLPLPTHSSWSAGKQPWQPHSCGSSPVKLFMRISLQVEQGRQCITDEMTRI
jgi:hypothetical protein